MVISLSVDPVMDWQPVKGVHCFLLPNGSWDRLNLPHNPELDEAGKKMMKMDE